MVPNQPLCVDKLYTITDIVSEWTEQMWYNMFISEFSELLIGLLLFRKG